MRAAARLAPSRGRLGRVVVAATALLQHPGTSLGAARDDAVVLLRLVRETLAGRYRRLPAAGLLAVVAGLIYFINPLDLIPDVLPMLGFADDAAILLWVTRQVRNEIASFTAWEREWGGAIDVETRQVYDPALASGATRADVAPDTE